MGYITTFTLCWRDPSVPEEHNPNLSGVSDEKNVKIRDWLLAEEDFYPEFELITETGAEG